MTSMAIEIERKFLVLNDAWRQGVAGKRMVQGYLSRDPHRTVRVRLAGELAWMTIKGPTSGISREEIEFPLEREIAESLLRMSLEKPVEKTRYEVEHAGMIWEVDEFHGANQGLIVAEIELPSEDFAFSLPTWVGQEVSADRRYSNASLARKPWSLW